MPTDDRDRQLERALTRHLGDTAPDAACPDAEILAAYHERTLSLEEMAQWKEHIAGCSRCQEALALVEQSEGVVEEDWVGQEVPVAEELTGVSRVRTLGAGLSKEMVEAAPSAHKEAPVRLPGKPGSRLNWRWVVPVGALAAAVIVWIGVRDIEMANKAAKESVGSQIAQNREAQPPAPVPGPAPPVTARSAPADALGRKDSPAPKAQVAENPADRAVLSPSPAGKSGDTAVVPQSAQPSEPGVAIQAGESGEGKALKPSPPGSASVETEMKRSRAAAAAQSAPVATGGAAGAPAHEPSAQLKLSPSRSETLEVNAAPRPNPSGSDLQVVARDSNDFMRMAAEDHRLIVAPGQKNVWRVGDGGSILRSTDGGKTWKRQNSGVTADLTSGSATSDKVAWIAGKTGTLLLTTDGGKHWKQITTPIDGDMGGVHAADAMHASIWDVPNRKSFETSDGGETWKPAGNE